MLRKPHTVETGQTVQNAHQLGLGILTLPKTNIVPENGWLEDNFPFRKAYFQGICSFQGGYPHNLSIHPSKGGMGVTCAHHGSLASIGGGSLAPIGGTVVQKTYTPLGLDMGTSSGHGV